MIINKIRELAEEFRSVLSGRIALIDSLAPPLIFLGLYTFSNLEVAMWGALAISLALAILRAVQQESLRFAVGGTAGVLLAIGLVRLIGRAEGFFLPGMLSSAGAAILSLISILFGRPLVAWTSHVARRWPLAWYWHPKVQPAYNEVTWLWAGYFGLRALLQLNFLRAQEIGSLALFNLLIGWPGTILLLVASYLYGTWRLRSLEGPSVSEFKANADPPWEGQRRGF